MKTFPFHQIFGFFSKKEIFLVTEKTQLRKDIQQN
jgi:hypothetical protein